LRELALHLLDIAENSVAARAKTIEIGVRENFHTDRLAISVKDDGIGMDAEMVARVIDPFVTSRTTRKVGLGIPLLKEAAEACNGFLRIQSEPGKGTLVECEFQHSHIDRMPLGDLGSTLINLVVAYPQIRWIFNYEINDARYVFDSAPIVESLGDVPLTEPPVLTYLRQSISEGIDEVRKTSSVNSRTIAH
jgi:hypothetical protein